MVTIELQFDFQEVAAVAAEDLRSYDDALLLHTLLILPVRWRVGANDVLDARSLVPSVHSAAAPLPIFNVDRLAPVAIATAYADGRAAYDLPGSGEKVYFERVGEDIEVTSPFTGAAGRAPLDSFQSALSAFHEDVVRLAREHLPGADAHPWVTGPEPWTSLRTA